MVSPPGYFSTHANPAKPKGPIGGSCNHTLSKVVLCTNVHIYGNRKQWFAEICYLRAPNPFFADCAPVHRVQNKLGLCIDCYVNSENGQWRHVFDAFFFVFFIQIFRTQELPFTRSPFFCLAHRRVQEWSFRIWPMAQSHARLTKVDRRVIHNRFGFWFLSFVFKISAFLKIIGFRQIDWNRPR